MKDLTEDNQLETADLVSVHLPDVKNHHLVRASDIVFRSRGKTTTTAVVDQEIGKAVIASPLIRIRVKSHNILASYLSWFINQSSAQAYFASHAKGTAVKMISKHAIENLDVPVPPLECQQKIVDIANLSAKEGRLLTALAKKRRQYAEGVLMKLAQSEAQEKTP